MLSEVRVPKDFQEYNKLSLYSNLSNELNQDVANAIYNKPFFSRYAALEFNGIVWWNDELGFWCVEISQNKKYVISHMCETLEELITEVKNIHGEN